MTFSSFDKMRIYVGKFFFIKKHFPLLLFRREVFLFFYLGTFFDKRYDYRCFYTSELTFSLPALVMNQTFSAQHCFM